MQCCRTVLQATERRLVWPAHLAGSTVLLLVRCNSDTQRCTAPCTLTCSALGQVFIKVMEVTNDGSGRIKIGASMKVVSASVIIELGGAISSALCCVCVMSESQTYSKI